MMVVCVCFFVKRGDEEVVVRLRGDGGIASGYKPYEGGWTTRIAAGQKTHTNMAASSALFGEREREVYDYCRDNMHKDVFDAFRVMCEFLGYPTTPPSPQMIRARTHLQLWELWVGENEFIKKMIQDDITQMRGVYLQLFPQEEYSGGTRGTLMQIRMESQVLDETPSMLPNSLLEISSSQEDWAFQTRGGSFMLDNNFMFSPQGQDLFGLYLTNLERCVEETLEFNVAEVIKKHGILRWQELLPEFPVDKETMNRLFDEATSNFAIIQKVKDGFLNILASAKRVMAPFATQPDVALVPGGAIRYMRVVGPTHTEHAIGGNNIYDKSVPEGPERVFVRDSHYGIQVGEMRPFKLPHNQQYAVYQPFSEVRTVGVFTYMHDITEGVVPDSDFRTSFLSIIIPSAAKTWKTVTLDEALNNLGGVFDSNGAITPYGADIFRAIINWYDKRRPGTTNKAPSGTSGLGLGGTGDFPPTSGAYDSTASTPTFGELFTFANREHKLRALLKQQPAKAEVLRQALDGGAPRPKRIAAEATAATAPEEQVKQLEGMITLWSTAGSPAERTRLEKAIREHVAKHGLTKKQLKSAAAEHVTEKEKFDALYAKVASGGMSEEEAGDVYDALASHAINLPLLTTLAGLDIRLPLGALLIRRTVRWEAGASVALRKGRQTGVLYVTRVLVELVRDGQKRQMGLNLNLDVQTVIHNRANICVFFDSFVTQYLGGLGSTYWSAEDNNPQRRQALVKDIHVVLTPGDWEPEGTWLDVTGYPNPRALAQLHFEPEPMCPTLPRWAREWRICDAMHPFARSSWVNQIPQDNTIVHQEYSRHCVPESVLGGQRPLVNYGSGHLGRVWTEDSMPALRGLDAHLHQSHYDSRATIVGPVVH
jgi:hypothetical protein